MPRQPTAFEQRVYDALCAVPAGRVTSYAALARRVGCGSARAVGQALRRNPFAPEVPCHRVIGAGGGLGGFSGAAAGPALAAKRRLLAAEGVAVDARGRLREPWRMWDDWPPDGGSGQQ